MLRSSLPGSNLATFEINNDFTGVTERHVYRRIYDDRIDLTFYVDADNYLPIRFFETWIKYAVGENVGDSGNGRFGSKSPNYFYRVRYPELYIAEQGLSITKFERTNTSNKNGVYTPKSILEYQFVNSFPISITSMPISYDTSSLLKCTVSMNYIRYYVNSTKDKMGDDTTNSISGDPSSPASQALFNNPQFGVDTSGLVFGGAEYYNNFGLNEQNATNFRDLTNGSNYRTIWSGSWIMNDK